MVKALLLMAEGFEEIELTSIVDILRRGGVTVSIAGLKKELTTGSRGIKIQPDIWLDSVLPNVSLYDAIVLPGGSPGYINLGKDQRLLGLILRYYTDGKLVAAICGAPSVLAKTGILSGKKATIFKGMEKELKGATYVDKPVVEDGNIITSQGPGTAIEFALNILKRLTNEKNALEIKERLIYNL